MRKMLVTIMLILGVFGFVYNYTFSDDLNLSEPQLVLDARCFSKIDMPFFLSNTLTQKEIYYNNLSETKKKSKIKMFIKNWKLILEPSFGYSVNDPTIRSLYKKDLGTFKEHFGNVPIFGFALELVRNNKGIKFGGFYQRSNPSYFSLYQPNEYLINYTMMKYYFQLSYDFHLLKKLYFTSYLGYSYSFVSCTGYDVNVYEGPTDLDAIYFPSKGAFSISFQIKYEINKILGIFILYNFYIYDYYDKDNLSFGLSFKVF